MSELSNLTMSEDEMLDSVVEFIKRLEYCEKINQKIPIEDFCKTLIYYTAYCVSNYGPDMESATRAYELALAHHHIEFNEQESL